MERIAKRIVEQLMVNGNGEFLRIKVNAFKEIMSNIFEENEIVDTDKLLNDILQEIIDKYPNYRNIPFVEEGLIKKYSMAYVEALCEHRNINEMETTEWNYLQDIIKENLQTVRNNDAINVDKCLDIIEAL